MENPERVRNVLNVIDESLVRIKDQAELYRRRADSERRWHTSFGATLAILGVAAPTLVTYEVQTPSSTFKIIAILLTAIVGAAGALQATFRWSDRFRRTSLTALALAELESSTRLALYDIRDTEDPYKVYQKAYELNESSQKRLQRIIRRHIEGEVALVTQEPETLKLGEGKKGPETK